MLVNLVTAQFPKQKQYKKMVKHTVAKLVPKDIQTAKAAVMQAAIAVKLDVASAGYAIALLPIFARKKR